MAMSGIIPDPPPTGRAEVSPFQVNHCPNGPRRSSSSPISAMSWRYVETSPSSSRSMAKTISLGSPGGEAME
jgi:hypothetical protein